ncbi:CHAT domain-containing protein [Streptomyces sp. NPDC059894]|uniref:CHAT domain-containing protein n=1 Tax=unclassified Streptomyces TaxID=2593676 RepID=UPI003651D38B
MSADVPGHLGLGGAVPQGPGLRGTVPMPEPLTAPRPTAIPEHVTESYDLVPLTPAPVNPDERLPEGFAKLSVHRAHDGLGQEMFWLTGHSEDVRLTLDSEDTRLRPSGITLDNLHKDGVAPSELLLAVADWSEGQEDLVRWINGLRARHGTELHLVIWDDTDYNIPWELLHLTEDDGRGLDAGILGALVTVVRWTTIRKAGTTPFSEPASCTGGVLGYYATEMRRDVGVFQNFEHTGHYGSTRTFLGELARGDLDAGLVYMGCHATYGQHVTDLRIGTVTWSELNRQPMPALSDGRTLVCLNACHSARSVRNTQRGENALRGFAELFLRKGAGGCIATSGRVGDDVAHTLVHELVGLLCEDPDLPVAQALRRFRAAAAARIPDPLPHLFGDDEKVDAEGQRLILPFLYSFMFLYFGHPLTTLRLTVRVQEARA